MKDDKEKKEKDQKRSKLEVLTAKYPPWPFCDFNAQDKEYFMDVRKLCGDGLDPKLKKIDEYVLKSDIVKLWGDVSSYKVSNLTLPEEDRQGMLDLY
jgi:hypothetical protein